MLEQCHYQNRDIMHYTAITSRYNDVIMSAIVSQITSLTIIYSTVYSFANQRNKAPRHWPLCGSSQVTGEFSEQMASNAKIFSIWWRHHCLNAYWTKQITRWWNYKRVTTQALTTVDNYIQWSYMWDVINHPRPTFNGGLAKPLLKLDMNDHFHPLFFVDVITYPCPNPDAGFALSVRLRKEKLNWENAVSVDAFDAVVSTPSVDMELTHSPPDKMATISQTIFSDAFSWMSRFVFCWSLFLRVQIKNNQALV